MYTERPNLLFRAEEVGGAHTAIITEGGKIEGGCVVLTSATFSYVD